MASESVHLQLHVHLVNGHVLWSVVNVRGLRSVMIARGTITDPYPDTTNLTGSLLMEAAYAAYRLL